MNVCVCADECGSLSVNEDASDCTYEGMLSRLCECVSRRYISIGVSSKGISLLTLYSTRCCKFLVSAGGRNIVLSSLSITITLNKNIQISGRGNGI